MRLTLVPAADIEPHLHAAYESHAAQAHEPTLVMPGESILASGRWTDIATYVSEHLPAMRAALRSMMTDVTTVHVGIGRDVGTLYGAYYALLEKRIPVTATFHSPHIGGDSYFAQRNRALLERLAAMVATHSASHTISIAPDAPPLKLVPGYHHIPLIDGLHISCDDRLAQ